MTSLVYLLEGVPQSGELSTYTRTEYITVSGETAEEIEEKAERFRRLFRADRARLFRSAETG